MPITVENAVQQLLEIVQQLRIEYEDKGRKFTLDGKLVGDIGEILVEMAYQVNLVSPGKAGFDATDIKGRQVQIKTTMNDSLYMNANHVPYYYLGIEVRKDGSFSEVYNGPGKKLWEEFQHKADGVACFPSKKRLRKLNETINPQERIDLKPEFYKDADGTIRRK